MLLLMIFEVPSKTQKIYSFSDLKNQANADCVGSYNF